MISCGFNHSLALTKNGQVFGWGKNTSEQLAVEGIDKYYKPIRIELVVHSIIKISCVNNHNLFLTNDKVIYWLRKDVLGIEGEENEHKLWKLKNSYIDMVSHWYWNVSIAHSIDDNYFFLYFSENILISKINGVKIRSLNEIFADFTGYTIDVSQKLVRFSDMYFKDGIYVKNFDEIIMLREGGYGIVYKVNSKLDKNNVCAIKKIRFKIKHKTKILREFLCFSSVQRIENEFLVRYFDNWLEKSGHEIILYILMQLCDKTLEQIIDKVQYVSELCPFSTINVKN
jgi:hypothetical protein